MLGILMPVAFAAAVMTTTPNIPQQTASDYIFTRDIPENNFVAYEAQAHDTIKNIAIVTYKDQAYWTTIWNDNHLIKNPEDIPQGTRISIRVIRPKKPAVLFPAFQNRLSSISEPIVQSIVVIAPQSIEASSTSYDDIYKAAGALYG